MLRLRNIYRFAAGLALTLATATAQTTAATWDSVKALQAGTEVRIAAGPRTVRGKIDRVSDDALALTSAKGQEMFTQQEVSRAWVKKPGHRKRNALIGLGVGAGVGLGVGLASREGPGGFGPNLDDAVTVGMTVAGALAGTIVGVLVPTGGWREIYKK